MKLALLILSLPLLSGCSLVGDAVDISSRRAQEVPLGAITHGDGFSVSAPEPYLYPKANSPTPGGVTFRPTEPMSDGMVYFVTPFSTQAANPSAALDHWNMIPERRGIKVTTSHRRNTTFQGMPAHEAVLDVPRSSSGGNISVVVVVKRDSDYLILNRGENYYIPSMKSDRLKLCQKGIVKLKASTKIKR
ncbi:hypothetical protein [Rubritalea sp.]|uniref:hypothetical protein n=1 Tax=Rubritalea sp. TaxID=2109375 RepID=UPI003EF547A8